MVGASDCCCSEKHFALPTWSLNNGFYYVIFCVLGTIVLRAIFFLFRAWAVQRGDFPDSESHRVASASKPSEIQRWELGEGWSFGKAYWECFKGFGKSRAHADFWLNALVGFLELLAYPIFIKAGYFTAVGGWVALKTAGSWGGWKVSRTSFNRFLLNNLLTIGLAYWLTNFVQIHW